MILKKPAMASGFKSGWLVRQRIGSDGQDSCLWQIARTLVEFWLRRLEQKKQAGGGNFALIVVASKFAAGCKIPKVL